MDENGYVINLELAKNILIEYFSTSGYFYGVNENFLKQIKSELVFTGDYYTFEDKNGGTFFGGPDGACGYWIQEMSEWIKWAKKLGSVSVSGLVSDLNNENKVFYEVNGELKCFIIHEGD